MSEKKWFLGHIKGTMRRVYLYDFSWDCNWYWGGGYIGSRDFHAHFDSAFLKTPDVRGHCLGNFITPWYAGRNPESAVVIDNGCSVWEPLSTFLDGARYDTNAWWRIKDLFKQFYAMRDAAEVFQYGGHCVAAGRTSGEINKLGAETLNLHIESILIPAIREAMDTLTIKKKKVKA